MRSPEEIKSIILSKAQSDDRIMAVLLQGSRANPGITPDRFQDFDIVYVVREMDSFISDHAWINLFGEILISQLPDAMDLFPRQKNASFHYLMLFKDGNRIDLNLLPLERLEDGYIPESLTVLLLDKDNLFAHLPTASDKDYWISRPREKEFSDCCNEFWWVCTYVAKGLCRNEITYAKEMLEIPVRRMFFKMIEWKIGVENNFSVAFGKCGKSMKNHLHKDLYERILLTYPGHRSADIWDALMLMTELFGEFAPEVSRSLGFKYHQGEQNQVRKYLRQLHPQTNGI